MDHRGEDLQQFALSIASLKSYHARTVPHLQRLLHYFPSAPLPCLWVRSCNAGHPALGWTRHQGRCRAWPLHVQRSSQRIYEDVISSCTHTSLRHSTYKTGCLYGQTMQDTWQTLDDRDRKSMRTDKKKCEYRKRDDNAWDHQREGAPPNTLQD